MEDLNPYAIAKTQFDRFAEALNLDVGIRNILRQPKRCLIVSIPTKLDDGSIRVFEGYRVSTASRGDRPRAASDITRASRSTR